MAMVYVIAGRMAGYARSAIKAIMHADALDKGELCWIWLSERKIEFRLLFRTMTYTLAKLSFKGHCELWPDAVDKSSPTPLYPLPPCNQLFAAMRLHLLQGEITCPSLKPVL